MGTRIDHQDDGDSELARSLTVVLVVWLLLALARNWGWI
jgi:hypothetical protein